jgi:geranylgeranyl pyrophosphate synthase
LISSDDPQIHVKYAKFGYALGMAFQIIDDIMDFTSDTAKLGKPVGNDLRQGIVTLPVIIYVETHPGDDDVSTLVNAKCLDEENVSNMIGKVRNSDSIEKAHQEAQEYINTATAILSDLEPGEYRSALLELASYITQRVS